MPPVETLSAGQHHQQERDESWLALRIQSDFRAGANQFFLNSAGSTPTVTRSNQYGGIIGGPVRIQEIPL
jgi:hypothetical protein